MRRTIMMSAVLLLGAACTTGTGDIPTTSASTSISTSTSASSATTTTQQAETTDTEEGASASALEALESELQIWGISDDSIQCVVDGLVEGGYVQGLDDLGMLDLLFVDETDPLTDFPPELAHFVDGFLYYLADPQEGCLRPSELATAIENLGIQADDLGYSNYGDDPTLDELYDGCAAGSLADCDMLYLVSDFGSEYENRATTCGGLVEEIDPTSTCMGFLQDFSETDDLARQCENGFFIACDAYFLVTIAGSEEESLATSCGGIRDSNVTTPCWITYGFGSR